MGDLAIERYEEAVVRVRDWLDRLFLIDASSDRLEAHARDLVEVVRLESLLRDQAEADRLRRERDEANRQAKIANTIKNNARRDMAEYAGKLAEAEQALQRAVGALEGLRPWVEGAFEALTVPTAGGVQVWTPVETLREIRRALASITSKEDGDRE